MKKLVIVSHTDHQYDEQGILKGWGPTINEINYLAQHWDEVVHVGCLYDGLPKGSSMPYTQSNIHFSPIPPFGGKSLIKKIGIILEAPKVIHAVKKALKGATHVQLRVPMGIGLYLIPWFALRKLNSYQFWVKYANNWDEKKPPLGFGIQRWMLKKNLARCKVTMNGFWPGQEAHCISFENPCLTAENIQDGRIAASLKEFKPPYNLIYIGRVEEQKGVGRLIAALKNIPSYLIQKVTVIGEGPLLEECIKNAAQLPHLVEFTGSLPQNEVHNKLNESHFIVLPTVASEGFPKVLAEAACFGCIPFCTQIGSVSHYLKHNQNGFIFNEKDIRDNLGPLIFKVIQKSPVELKNIALAAHSLAGPFTYSAYFNKLKLHIFKKKEQFDA